MVSKRLSGILAHPTSFPSRFGIGDLGNGAYEFIDFLYESGQKLWQLLPINPTGYGDSPYQSHSAFACNPLLISPELLFESGLLKKEDIEDIPVFDVKNVDYGPVIKYKNILFKKAYENFTSSKDASLTEGFTGFCRQHAGWLDDYSLFFALKNRFIQENVWNTWPEDAREKQPAALDDVKPKLKMEIDLCKFLQYIFSIQWKRLKEYANDRGILIIGDISIFAAYDSADVWGNQELFLLDSDAKPTAVAGVPPDYFSETGQLWGNPLYNWKKHAETGFSWWVSRIKRSLDLVDIVRIDHFRGFESYWSIPFGEKTAVNGKWVKAPGKQLFTEIKKQLGDLPIIAEDLGIITEEVDELRKLFCFPGMKVLQFGFEGGAESTHMPHNFKNSAAVVYTGTHDNDTSTGWYSSAGEKEKDYFRRYMNTNAESPSWDLIRLAFMSSADMAVVPLQDVLELGSEGRMNTPGEAQGWWRFRYASRMLAEGYAKGLKYLSELSGRNIEESIKEADDDDEASMNVKG